jgi:hypothetical protein
LFLLVGTVLLYLLIPRSSGDWRQLSLSLGGYANSSAVISISNGGPVSVVLRDHFDLEYVGIAPPSPVTGLTNLVRLTPTGTNLTVGPSARADFLVPVPTEGQRWIARLEFAPAGIKTKLGENLIRRQDRLSTSLPTTVRGVPVYTVSQEFAR